jgi:flagellar biosynthesis GTPase FlhF
MARASPGQFNYQALLFICMITATATRALQLFASKTLHPVMSMSMSMSTSMSTSVSTSVSTASRQQQQQHKQQVLIIAGPTGVGKSSVAAILSSQLKGMIVSADSVQTYRGVQIGANKPTQQERLPLTGWWRCR